MRTFVNIEGRNAGADIKSGPGVPLMCNGGGGV